MGNKYAKYEYKQIKPRRWKVHPIWRGIGVVLAGVCERLGVIDAYRKLPADVRALTTPSTLLQMFLLFEYQVATMDRKSFGRIGTERLHFLRLSIATDIESLRVAVDRIATASKDAAGFEAFVKKGDSLS